MHRPHIPTWRITAVVTRKIAPYIARRVFTIQGYSLDNVMERVHKQARIQRILGVVRVGEES